MLFTATVGRILQGVNLAGHEVPGSGWTSRGYLEARPVTSSGDDQPSPRLTGHSLGGLTSASNDARVVVDEQIPYAKWAHCSLKHPEFFLK